MQDEFIEPLESYLARAITRLQEPQTDASSVVEVLETLGSYEAFREISENAPQYPQLSMFQKKKAEIFKKLPELSDSEIRSLTLDLVREIKQAIVERYYPPLEHVSSQSLPDANVTLATVQANARHSRHALEALREHKQQRHREFVHGVVNGWGPLLQTYYSGLGETLDENAVSELVSHARSEIETELLHMKREDREKLTTAEKEQIIQHRLNSMTTLDVERLTDRVLARSISVAFYGSGAEAETKVTRLQHITDTLIDAERFPQDAAIQERKAQIIKEVQILPPADPEQFVIRATEQMKPLRERYIADLIMVDALHEEVVENIGRSLDTKIPDVDFMVARALDEASERPSMSPEESRQIILESKEATIVAAVVESETTGFSPGDVFRDAMLQSASPATRALGNLFGLLSPGKQEQLIQEHFGKAWNTVITKIVNNDAEITRKLGRQFVESDLFKWWADQGARSFSARSESSGAMSFVDTFVGPMFSAPAVASQAFGNAEESVVSYFNYAKQNQPFFDRIREKDGLESIKKMFEDIQKERSIHLMFPDGIGPQQTLPVVATIRSLDPAHFPTRLPDGSIIVGIPKPNVTGIPTAAHARSSILLRNIHRLEQAEIFSKYSLYVLHINEQFPSLRYGGFAYLQSGGRWALGFVGRQAVGKAGKATARTLIAGLAKFGVSKAAFTAVGGVLTGGIGLIAGFAASALSSVLKTLMRPEGMLRRLRGEEPLKLSDTPAILVLVFLVIFIVVLKPPDFYDAELAARAPSGGGGESGPDDQAVPYDLATEPCDPSVQECRWPAAGCIVQGPRTSGGSHAEGGTAENSIDIVGTYMSPIYATVNGTIESMYDQCQDNTGYYGNRCGGGLGNYLRIRSDDGILLVFAHLSQTGMKKSGRVTVGEIIGYMDHNGYSGGHHLHYEVESGHDINSILPFPVPPCSYDAAISCSTALGARRCVSP